MRSIQPGMIFRRIGNNVSCCYFILEILPVYRIPDVDLYKIIYIQNYSTGHPMISHLELPRFLYDDVERFSKHWCWELV